MVRFYTQTKKAFMESLPEAEIKIGLLIEYKKWEKIATILHEGNIRRVHARNVEKSGKRDVSEKR